MKTVPTLRNRVVISILFFLAWTSIQALGSPTTYDQNRVDELNRLIRDLELVKQKILSDHPGDTRPPHEIVKTDISFEEKVDAKLRDVRLLVAGAWADARTFQLDSVQKKLEKYNMKVDPSGNHVYFTKPFPLGLPLILPPQGQFITFSGMLQIIDDLIAGNENMLDTRKAQLQEMEKLAACEKELENLVRLGKTVEDLWIFDTDLEDTAIPTRFKALVGSTLKLTVFVRYKDGTKEQFSGSNPDAGVIVDYGIYEVYLSGQPAMVIEDTKEYPISVHFSDGKTYRFTVIGHANTDLFSFVKPSYHIKEGPDAVIEVGVKRTGTGKGRVELRFREVHSAGLGYGDYSIIDPFPVWEDGQTGIKTFRIKVEDNDENTYTKTLTLHLIPSEKVTITGFDYTAISIEDDDLAGEFKFTKPEYIVYESDKTVEIEIQRIGQTILESSQLKIRTRDGSALAGQDYTALDSLIPWDLNDLSQVKKITIPILEDTTAENEETFQVILAKDSKQEFALVRILEKDPSKAPAVQRAKFNSPSYSVDEGQGTAVVQVVREGGSKGRFSIDVYTQDASARDGVDYHGVRQTLTWQDGDTAPKQIQVSIIDDQEIEDPVEKIHLQLENPVNPSFPVDYHPTATESVLEITDNDGGDDSPDKPEEDEDKSSPVFRAAPECGNSFELAPGDFTGRGCGINVYGVRSGTAGRVEVKFSYNKSRGLDIFPGDTSTPPSLIYSSPYTFAQSFRAESDADPGIVPVTVTVSQQGAGTVTFNMEILILEKGQTPSSGSGIRPPVDMATGSGGTYCVWRYKMFGDPPACFHFASAPCDSARYRQTSYELVGQSMTWGEADALMSRLSRYQKDAYGCLDSLFPTKPDKDGDGTPDDEDECDEDPKKQKEGKCGCGISDEDSDEDGAPDCHDECDDDPKKQKEGECGCNVPDEDKDGNGIMDCNEKKASLSAIQISPGSATIDLNGSANFSATVFDDSGKTLSSQEAGALSISWAVNDPSVANISGTGPQATVSPIKAGTVTVMLSAPGVSAYATVVIKEPDEDTDGVSDDRDNCPGTPPGTKVDTDGCPIKEEGPSDEDCRSQGYVLDPNTGKCTDPTDEDYGGFLDTHKQKEDEHAQGQSNQAAADQNAAGSSTGSDDLSQDMDNIQAGLTKTCYDDNGCPSDKTCKNGVCVKKESSTSSGSQGTTTSSTATSDCTTSGTATSGTATSGTASSGTATSGTATSGTTTQPAADPAPQDPAVQNRTLKWNSPTVCSEAEGTSYGWKWLVILNQSGTSVSGDIYFHNCPGGGRASYRFTGTANSGDTFTVSGTRTSSRGPLANTAPQKKNFTLRHGQAPSPSF